MTTVMINEQLPVGAMLLEYISRHPQGAQVVNDNAPLPFPAEELVSLESFKHRMETLAHSRLGLTLTL